MLGEPKHKIPLLATTEDGRYIDINTIFKWTSSTLTDRQRLFVFYYLCPVGGATKPATALEKAGYNTRHIAQGASRLLTRGDIQAECRNISGQLLRGLTRGKLEEALSGFVEAKAKRCKVRPCDYYNFTKDGDTLTITPKPPSELTEEQRELILDVEYIGAKGLPHYKLPNKIEAEEQLIRLYGLLGGFETQSATGYEVEATSDIIKGELTTRLKVIEQNKELSALAGLGAVSDIVED